MDIEPIAKQVFAVLETGRQITPFSKVYPDFGLKEAYRVAGAVRAKREARGERPIGRKIGFTNRTIWAEYGVYAPIWGYVYDRTVRDLTPEALEVSLDGLAEPRIEPEIIFGLGAPPAAGMDERALIRCIDWIAHGFEIVQSTFPNWSFQAAGHSRGLRPAWQAVRRTSPCGRAAARRMGARAFAFRDRSFPQRRPDRPWRCGQRPRRPAIRAASSGRDPGAGSVQSAPRRRRNRDHRNAHARFSGRGGRDRAVPIV